MKLFIRNLSFLLLALLATPAAGAPAYLDEAVDQIEAAVVSQESAAADFSVLSDTLLARYPYLDFYERRWSMEFSREAVRAFHSLLGVHSSGPIPAYEFKAALTAATSRFRDAHSYMLLKGNAQLALNIGLYFDPTGNSFLVYRVSEQILRQLSMSRQEFESRNFRLNKINDIPLAAIIAAMDSYLPYSNPTTRRTYGALILGSSKGVLLLSALVKLGKIPRLTLPLRLEFESITGLETRSAEANIEPLEPWGIDDLVAKVEGRHSSLGLPDFSPETVARIFGIRHEARAGNIHLLKIPSWAPDLVHGEATEPSRRALYQYFTGVMTSLPEEATLLLDLRGNRGGDTILWRPILRRLMQEDHAVVGLVQLGE